MSVFILTVTICSLLQKSASFPANFSNEESPLSQRCLTNSARCSCNGSITCSETSPGTCPPGLFCKEGHCECGVYPYDIIRCNGTRAFVFEYYCPSYDEERNLTLLGSCPRRINNSDSFVGDTLYQLLTGNVHQLDHMCKYLNKTGVLCGQCLPDHYPLAYSFNMNCITCQSVWKNWLRYIVAAYFPLTLFYIFILFCKINAISSHLFPLVYFCQTLSMPVLARAMYIEFEGDYNLSLLTASKITLSLYGMWNLDFFRPMYTDLCLGIGILPTLALDYLIAVYPLLLIMLTYLLINLYDRNYRVVTIIWRPFRVFFSLCRRNWNIQTSVIDAFATFFLLTNMKFLSVSFDLLIPTKVYQLYSDHYNHTLGLYYSGNIEYFGKEHLPYAILAIIVLCVLVVLPVTVLVLYPFSFFQKFISMFPIRWHALHIFVDCFYGCYTDGTQPGTRDCRWCAAALFIARFCQFLLYSFMESKIMYNIMITLVLILYTTLIAVLQPYKSSLINGSHVIFAQMLTVVALSGIGISLAAINAHQYFIIFYVLGCVCSMFGLIYLAASACHWIYVHKKFGLNLILRLKAWRRGYAQLSDLEPNTSLPDRIENSHEYHRENLANFISQQET